jgi:hypothetical protein
MRWCDPSTVPPPPRRLTPESLKRLRKEFTLTTRGLLLFYAFMLIMQVPAFIVTRVSDDVLLEIHHKEAVGRAREVKDSGGWPYAAWFEFELGDGQRHEDFSFTGKPSRLPAPGSEVTVQYVPGRPQICRIAGMRRGLRLWGWFLPLLLVLPMSPVIDVVLRLVRRRQALCEKGVATTGRLLRPNRLEVLVWRRRFSRARSPYWALNYSFEDAQGRTRRGCALMRRTPFPLEPGDEVTVIYDRTKPRRSIVVEALGLVFEGTPSRAAA